MDRVRLPVARPRHSVTPLHKEDDASGDLDSSPAERPRPSDDSQIPPTRCARSIWRDIIGNTCPTAPPSPPVLYLSSSSAIQPTDASPIASPVNIKPQVAPNVPESISAVSTDSSTCSEHVISPGEKPRKKRKRFGNLEREETAETRQVGACMACRVQKERCVPDENGTEWPCKRCTRILASRSKKVIRRAPCYRTSSLPATFASLLNSLNSASHGLITSHGLTITKQYSSQYLLGRCCEREACKLVGNTYRIVVDHAQSLTQTCNESEFEILSAVIDLLCALRIEDWEDDPKVPKSQVSLAEANRVLKLLEKRLLHLKDEAWFTSYLVIFMLLYEISVPFKDPSRWSRTNEQVAIFVGLRTCAMALLATWQYVQRQDLRDLDFEALDETQLKTLSNEQTKFVEESVQIIRESNIPRTPEEGWHELYFIAQMFKRWTDPPKVYDWSTWQTLAATRRSGSGES